MNTEAPLPILIVIPARYASTRFPGKPLALLGGKPVLQWVWEAVMQVKFEKEVVVATDDERIASAARSFGAEVEMTSADCQSGTDRCQEVLRKRLQDDPDCYYRAVINVQGDEPFVSAEELEYLVSTLSFPGDIFTLATRINSTDELLSPNNVKVVFTTSHRALYFSRTPIPYIVGVPTEEWIEHQNYFKHVGIYAFRTKILLDILPSDEYCFYEHCERLEQLRWLAWGYDINVGLVDHVNIGIDTPEDLAQAEAYLQQNNPNKI